MKKFTLARIMFAAAAIAAPLIPGIVRTARCQALLSSTNQPIATDNVSLNLDFSSELKDADESYAAGMRAIQESRWADAESAFEPIVKHGGNQTDSALYWLAYAEQKQGKSDQALKHCGDLRTRYATSRWIEDCGALEIEIRGSKGNPVDPNGQKDESLKILALNQLMQKDEAAALPQIEAILSSNEPEDTREQALFLLSQSASPASQRMLAHFANPGTNPSNQSDQALQQRARQLLAASHAAASNAPQGIQMNRSVPFDVFVTDKQGQPVTGLTAQEFTVFDNGQPQKFTMLRPPDRAKEAMIVIDTLNTSVENVAYERQQLSDFLRKQEGKLPYMVSIYLFVGDRDDMQPVMPASDNGLALADALDKAAPNSRFVRRSEAYYGAVERIQRSVSALGNLIVEASKRPGRKVLLWLSPGWPLLAADDASSSYKEAQVDFGEIVFLTDALMVARITLYGIDAGRYSGSTNWEWFRYQSYLKPVTKTVKAQLGNFSMQVLAEHSGGRALNFSDQYLSGEIASCLRQDGTAYLLVYDQPTIAAKNEYHALTVRVNTPGLKVRTMAGYYGQPSR